MKTTNLLSHFKDEIEWVGEIILSSIIFFMLITLGIILLIVLLPWRKHIYQFVKEFYEEEKKIK